LFAFTGSKVLEASVIARLDVAPLTGGVERMRCRQRVGRTWALDIWCGASVGAVQR
jgi:hypothetical protein